MADDSTIGTIAQPTQKEAFFFLNIMNCMKNKPEVDWDRVAQMSNYSNGGCAKTRFGQIKKRLGYTNGAQASSAVTTVRRPKNEKAVSSGTNVNTFKVTKKKSQAKSKGKKATVAEDEEQQLSATLKGEDTSHNYYRRGYNGFSAGDEEDKGNTYCQPEDFRSENYFDTTKDLDLEV